MSGTFFFETQCKVSKVVVVWLSWQRHWLHQKS